MSTINTRDRGGHHRPWLTGIGYLCIGLAIYAGWSLSDLHLIDAADGLGYWLGITGASMMLLLLLYPVRKRARWLRNAGPVRHWFRVHMILGLLGPLLVLIHSNFTLGSINSRVALFCTLIVAGSGIFGRYLYAKTHNGLYGQKLTLELMREDIEANRMNGTALADIVAPVDQALTTLETRTIQADDRLLSAVALAIEVVSRILVLRLRIRRLLREQLHQLRALPPASASSEKRALDHTFQLLERRLSTVRTFAQLRACERLFSLWHIIHYPLFMVMVVAAVVHVIAVHMY
jgi:hypothetical protein